MAKAHGFQRLRPRPVRRRSRTQPLAAATPAVRSRAAVRGDENWRAQMAEPSWMRQRTSDVAVGGELGPVPMQRLGSSSARRPLLRLDPCGSAPGAGLWPRRLSVFPSFKRCARGSLGSLTRADRGFPVTSRDPRVAQRLSRRRRGVVQPRSVLMRLDSPLVCLNRPRQSRFRRTSSISCPPCRHLRSAPEFLQSLGEFGLANGGDLSPPSRSLSSQRRCAGGLLRPTIEPVHCGLSSPITQALDRRRWGLTLLRRTDPSGSLLHTAIGDPMLRVVGATRCRTRLPGEHT